MIDEQEFKKKLTPDEYRILREKGTEMPFSGTLLHEKRNGMYVCKGCGTEIFSSDAKFDSGTGWPSFDRAISGSVVKRNDTDHGLNRTEIICAKCGSHLGHVFNDGPTKTGERYCINSVCLDFDKRDLGKDNK